MGNFSQKKLHFEAFPSITEFEKVLAIRPNNKIMSDAAASMDDDSDFCGTVSFKEAQNILHNGFQQGLDAMTKCEAKIQVTRFGKKNIPKAHVMGYAPHVPNAILGIPCSMIYKDQIKQKSKILTLYYNCSATCSEDSKDLTKAAVKLLNVIEALEVLNYRVNLYICEASYHNDVFMFAVKLKDAKQPLNLLKISYPFLHPSFLRRHTLKWIETYPDMTDSGMKFGYGTPLYKGLNLKKSQQYLKKNGILKNSDFYVDYLFTKNNSIDDLITLFTNGSYQKEKSNKKSS